MFYLAIITTAKISVLRSLRELTPQKPHRLLTRLTKVLVVLCAVSSILALSFMCSFPRPWIFMGDKKCIDRAALWIFVAIWDITTDISIIIMPIGTLLDRPTTIEADGGRSLPSHTTHLESGASLVPRGLRHSNLVCAVLGYLTLQGPLLTLV